MDATTKTQTSKNNLQWPPTPHLTELPTISKEDLVSLELGGKVIKLDLISEASAKRFGVRHRDDSSKMPSVLFLIESANQGNGQITGYVLKSPSTEIPFLKSSKESEPPWFYRSGKQLSFPLNELYAGEAAPGHLIATTKDAEKFIRDAKEVQKRREASEKAQRKGQSLPGLFDKVASSVNVLSNLLLPKRPSKITDSPQIQDQSTGAVPRAVAAQPAAQEPHIKLISSERSFSIGRVLAVATPAAAAMVGLYFGYQQGWFKFNRNEQPPPPGPLYTQKGNSGAGTGGAENGPPSVPDASNSSGVSSKSPSVGKNAEKLSQLRSNLAKLNSDSDFLDEFQRELEGDNNRPSKAPQLENSHTPSQSTAPAPTPNQGKRSEQPADGAGLAKSSSANTAADALIAKCVSAELKNQGTKLASLNQLLLLYSSDSDAQKQTEFAQKTGDLLAEMNESNIKLASLNRFLPPEDRHDSYIAGMSNLCSVLASTRLALLSNKMPSGQTRPTTGVTSSQQLTDAGTMTEGIKPPPPALANGSSAVPQNRLSQDGIQPSPPAQSAPVSQQSPPSPTSSAATAPQARSEKVIDVDALRNFIDDSAAPTSQDRSRKPPAPDAVQKYMNENPTPPGTPQILWLRSPSPQGQEINSLVICQLPHHLSRAAVIHRVINLWDQNRIPGLKMVTDEGNDSVVRIVLHLNASATDPHALARELSHSVFY